MQQAKSAQHPRTPPSHHGEHLQYHSRRRHHKHSSMNLLLRYAVDPSTMGPAHPQRLTNTHTRTQALVVRKEARHSCPPPSSIVFEEMGQVHLRHPSYQRSVHLFNHSSSQDHWFWLQVQRPASPPPPPSPTTPSSEASPSPHRRTRTTTSKPHPPLE